MLESLEESRSLSTIVAESFHSLTASIDVYGVVETRVTDWPIAKEGMRIAKLEAAFEHS